MIGISTLLLAACVAGAGDDGILEVPGEYVTIQAAINAAVDGQEVLVDAGVYYEHISFMGKTIVVRSRDGADVTVIDGEGANGTIVQIPNGSSIGTALEGFSVRNAHQAANNTGAGIHLYQGASIRIGNCRISDCTGQHGAGMTIRSPLSSDGAIFHLHDSVIADCTATHNGGLIDMGPSSLTGFRLIERCQFIGGHSWNSASDIYGNIQNPTVITDCVFDGGSGTALGALKVSYGVIIEGCVFRNGSGGGYGSKAGDALSVGMFAGESHAQVQNCVFLNNGAPVAAVRDAADVTGIMSDSVFCNNSSPNLQGPWQLDNVLELNGCPEELDCNADGQIDWIQCVTHPELDTDGDWIPDVCQIIDCNDNGIDDADDIADGGSTDYNGNGVPDECECIGDIAGTGDGLVGVEDMLIVIAQWGMSGSIADLDGNGTVDVNDLLLVITMWGPCP